MAQSVEELMNSPIVSVTPAMSAAQALQLAYQHRVHHLPVVDNQEPIGMVCTCDLEESKPTDSVSKSMRSPPVFARADTLDSDALALMNSQGVGSLLINKGTRTVGIVTRKDLRAAGVPMLDDPRGFCSCCAGIAHLKEHATGALCTDCFSRSVSPEELFDHGGGD